MLNTNSVSVVTQKFVEAEGIKYQIGDHRTGYENSVRGRERLKNEVSEPYLSAILAVWGDSPTVVIPATENKEKNTDGSEETGNE
jgi:hypothetical protein